MTALGGVGATLDQILVPSPNMWEPKVKNRQNNKRLKLLERDGNKCWLCGGPFSKKRPPSLDHVIPKCKGGTTALNNMKLAHSKCNYKRGSTGYMPQIKH